LKLRLLTIVALSAAALTACGPAIETEPARIAEPAVLDPLPLGDGTRENPFVGRGFIDEIGETELLIEHEDIPGYMPSMRMAFPVIEEVDMTGLSVGDQIRFEIEIGGDIGYQVIRIDPVGGE
jgi:hypothetical protein